MVYLYNYHDFTVLIVRFLNAEDKLEQFRASFLTPPKFIILRIALLIVTTLYGLLIFFARISKVNLFIGETRKDAILVFHNLVQEIKSLSFPEKTIAINIFIFIIGFHLFYFIRFPIFIDEAFSYVHFVSKGFLTSASYYPGPNNHVFYSELCVFINLFFDDPLLVMRLPAFLSGLALSFLFFLVLKKYLGFQISLLSTIIFSLSEQTNFYSSQGRGYILVTFFVFLAFYSLGQFLFNSRRFYLLLFVVSSVLGFYTLPVFLYPFASMFLWTLFIIWKKQDRYLFFKTIALYSVIVVLFLILYLPVLLLNPADVVFGNTWVSSPADFYNKFPEYILHLNSFWWGDGFSLLFSLAAIAGLAWLGAKQHVTTIAAIILLFFLPFFMIFIQKVLPFERVWLYYLLFLSAGLAYFIIKLIGLLAGNTLSQKVTGIACIIITLGFYTLLNYRILERKTFSYYTELDQFLARIDSLHVKNIQASDPEYNTFIRLHSMEKNTSLKIVSGQDAMTKPDLMVTPKDQPLQDSTYFFLFHNSYINAYKRRD
ncbi:MAG TPA: glycosyltransferase family 39 protein [Cytophagaceae bacterium]|nr:glycosyltransferase family 39 protein [Cytophagaceae bacterium]